MGPGPVHVHVYVCVGEQNLAQCMQYDDRLTTRKARVMHKTTAGSQKPALSRCGQLSKGQEEKTVVVRYLDQKRGAKRSLFFLLPFLAHSVSVGSL